MSQNKYARKGLKTAYVSTIVGIVLVLFIIGVVSWFALGLNHLKDSKIESFEIEVYFDESVNDVELGLIELEIDKKKYTNTARYRSSDEAWEMIKGEMGGDSTLSIIDNQNPINQHIIMTLKKEYFSRDSMAVIEKDLKADYGESLFEISYRPEIFDDYNKGLQRLVYFVHHRDRVASVEELAGEDQSGMISNFFSVFGGRGE